MHKNNQMSQANQVDNMHQANHMTSEIGESGVADEFWESGTPPLSDSCKSRDSSKSGISGASNAFS